MVEPARCEYCGRHIKRAPEIRTRRGKKHVYCSEFCFILHFYDAPAISYISLKLD
jgi:YHS domain-containing protein